MKANNVCDCTTKRIISDRFDLTAQMELLDFAKSIVPCTNITNKSRCAHVTYHEHPRDEDFFISVTS